MDSKVFLVAGAMIFHLGTAWAQQPTSICQAVLNSAVFNLGETRYAEQFASGFKDAFCQTEWQSEEDISRRGRSFGFSFEDLSRTIGLSASDAKDNTKRKQSFDLFCSRTEQDIAYSSAFFRRFRSSDVAVRAWSDCVKNAQGHFAMVNPDATLTGATITLTKVASGRVPALDIISVESAIPGAINCFHGTTKAEDATFAEGDREVVITCAKRADESVTFALNTNWGVYDQIKLRGFSQSLSDLSQETALMRSNLTRRDADLQTDLDRERGRIDTATGGNACFFTDAKDKISTDWIDHSCPAGSYAAGLRSQHNPGVFWYQERTQLKCCKMK